MEQKDGHLYVDSECQSLLISIEKEERDKW